MLIQLKCASFGNYRNLFRWHEFQILHLFWSAWIYDWYLKFSQSIENSNNNKFLFSLTVIGKATPELPSEQVQYFHFVLFRLVTRRTLLPGYQSFKVPRNMSEHFEPLFTLYQNTRCQSSKDQSWVFQP